MGVGGEVRRGLAGAGAADVGEQGEVGDLAGRPPELEQHDDDGEVPELRPRPHRPQDPGQSRPRPAGEGGMAWGSRGGLMLEAVGGKKLQENHGEIAEIAAIAEIEIETAEIDFFAGN